ncbi:T9SS type A sorting domain-containing protein [Dyadobacter sp. NIV53]|uniref:T9SS type A sorting domain-containing protein n=1 Tax=Dyadobacter sp. NIV53 TaxID=2861765 RepID=UPI001C87CE4D|nr:T9SS type A sorting domain-containing protein [Dyadobacter sp. NIV53]
MKKFNTYVQITLLAISVTLAFDTKAQVIFRDDFNRSELGSGWLTRGYPEWSILNNQAYSFYDGTGAILITSKKYTQRNYLIETIALPLKNSYHRQYSILFGKPNPDQDYGYVLKYNPEYNQGLTLGRSEGNDYYPVVLKQKALILDPSKSHTFKIEHFPNGLIRVFINSGSGYSTQPVLEATDNTYTTLGHFGWKVDTETSAEAFSVDWFEVRVLPKLITNPVTAGGAVYSVANLGTGVPVYVDRNFTITSLPSFLKKASFIQTGNNTKNDIRASYLSFKLSEKSYIYVLYDPRATTLPAWLQGWQKLNDKVYTTDSGTSYLNVYAKEYPAGNITVGGNLAAPAAGALTNYIVAAVPSSDNLLARQMSGDIEELEPEYNTNLSNFPNPAQSQTTIQYQLPESGFVKLTVFDKQGQSLKVLANEYQIAGEHRQQVDVQGLTNGIYIYQLQTGLQNRTGKMLISR